MDITFATRCFELLWELTRDLDLRPSEFIQDAVSHADLTERAGMLLNLFNDAGIDPQSPLGMVVYTGLREMVNDKLWELDNGKVYTMVDLC